MYSVKAFGLLLLLLSCSTVVVAQGPLTTSALQPDPRIMQMTTTASPVYVVGAPYPTPVANPTTPHSLYVQEGFCIPKSSKCMYSTNIGRRVASSVAGFMAIEGKSYDEAFALVQTWVSSTSIESRFDSRCFWEAFNEAVREDLKVYNEKFSKNCVIPDEPHRPDRPNWPERPDRPHKPDRPDWPHRPDRPDWPHRPDRPDRPHKPHIPNEPYRPKPNTSTRIDERYHHHHEHTKIINKTVIINNTIVDKPHPWTPSHRPRVPPYTRPRHEVERYVTVRNVNKIIEHYETVTNVTIVKQRLEINKTNKKEKLRKIRRLDSLIEKQKLLIKDLEESLRRARDTEGKERIIEKIRVVEKTISTHTTKIFKEKLIVHKIEEDIHQDLRVKQIDSYLHEFHHSHFTTNPTVIKEKEVIIQRLNITLHETNKKIIVIEKYIFDSENMLDKVYKDRNTTDRTKTINEFKDRIKKLQEELKTLKADKISISNKILKIETYIEAFKIYIGKDVTTRRDDEYTEEEVVEDDSEVEVHSSVNISRLVTDEEFARLEKRLREDRYTFESISKRVQNTTQNLTIVEKLLSEEFQKLRTYNITSEEATRIRRRIQELELSITKHKTLIFDDEILITELEAVIENQEETLFILREVVRRTSTVDGTKKPENATKQDIFDDTKSLDARVILRRYLKEREREITDSTQNLHELFRNLQRKQESIIRKENKIVELRRYPNKMTTQESIERLTRRIERIRVEVEKLKRKIEVDQQRISKDKLSYEVVAEVYIRSRPTRYIERVEPITSEELQLVRESIAHEREITSNLTRELIIDRKTYQELTVSLKEVITVIERLTRNSSTAPANMTNLAEELKIAVEKKTVFEKRIERLKIEISQKEVEVITHEQNLKKLIIVERDLKQLKDGQKVPLGKVIRHIDHVIAVLKDRLDSLKRSVSKTIKELNDYKVELQKIEDTLKVENSTQLRDKWTIEREKLVKLIYSRREVEERLVSIIKKIAKDIVDLEESNTRRRRSYDRTVRKIVRRSSSDRVTEREAIESIKQTNSEIEKLRKLLIEKTRAINNVHDRNSITIVSKEIRDIEKKIHIKEKLVSEFSKTVIIHKPSAPKYDDSRLREKLVDIKNLIMEDKRTIKEIRRAIQDTRKSLSLQIIELRSIKDKTMREQDDGSKRELYRIIERLREEIKRTRESVEEQRQIIKNIKQKVIIKERVIDRTHYHHNKGDSHDTDHSYSTDIRNTYHKIIVDNRVDQRVGKQIKVIVSRIEKLEITISQETRIIRDLNERLKVVRDESERTEIYKKIKRSELLIKTYRKEIEHETKFIKVIQTTTSTSKTEKKKAVKQLVKEVKKFEKVIKKEQHLVIVLKKKLETSSSSTSSTERDIMITKIAQLEKHIKHVKQVVAQEKKVIKVVKKTVIVKSDQDHSHDHSHDTDHSYSTDIRNTYHKIIVDNRVDQRVGKQIKVIVSRIEKLEITISQETRIIRDLNERLKVVRDESERTEIYKKIKRSELLIKTYRKEIEHETKFIKVIQTTTSTSKTEKKKAVKQLVKEVKKFEKVIKKEQHLVIVLKKKLETSSSSTSSTERDIMITKIAQLEKHIKHVKQVVAQEKKVIKVVKKTVIVKSDQDHSHDHSHDTDHSYSTDIRNTYHKIIVDNRVDQRVGKQIKVIVSRIEKLEITISQETRIIRDLNERLKVVRDESERTEIYKKIKRSELLIKTYRKEIEHETKFIKVIQTTTSTSKTEKKKAVKQLVKEVKKFEKVIKKEQHLVIVLKKKLETSSSSTSSTERDIMITKIAQLEKHIKHVKQVVAQEKKVIKVVKKTVIVKSDQDHSHDHSHDTDHSYSTDIRNTYHKIIVDNRVDQRVGKQIKVIVSRIEKLEITISQETRIIRDLNERLKVVRDESERTEIYKKIKRSELLIKTYRKEIEHETKFIKVIQTTTSTSKTEKKKAVKQLVKEVKKFEKVIKKEQHLVIVLKKKLETSSSSTSSTERDIMITKIAQLEKHIKHVKQVVAQEKKVIKVVKKTVIVKSDQDHSHDHSHDTDHSYSTDIRNTYHKIIVDNRVDQRVGKQIKVIVSRIEKLEITISQETRIIRDLNERLKVVRDESERTEIYKKIKRSELLIKTYRKEIEHETKFIKVIQTTTSTSKTEKKKAVKQLVKEVKKFEKVIKKEQHLVIVLKKKLETSSSSTSSTERDIMITKIAQLEKHIKHVKQVVAQEKKVIKVVKKTVIVKSDQDHSHDHSHDTDHSYSTDIRNTYHKIIVDNRVDQRVGKQIKVIVSRIEKLEITISQETRIIRDLNERLKVVRDESERTEIYKKIKRSELLIKTYRKEIEHETKFIKVIQTTTSTSKTEKKKAVKQLVKEVKKFEKVIKKEQHLVIVLKKKLETSSSSTSSTERDIMITKIAQLEKHIKHVKQVVAQEKKVIKVVKKTVIVKSDQDHSHDHSHDTDHSYSTDIRNTYHKIIVDNRVDQRVGKQIKVIVSRIEKLEITISQETRIIRDLNERLKVVRDESERTEIYKKIKRSELLIKTYRKEIEHETKFIKVIQTTTSTSKTEKKKAVKQLVKEVKKFEKVIKKEQHLVIVLKKKLETSSSSTSSTERDIMITKIAQLEKHIKHVKQVVAQEKKVIKVVKKTVIVKSDQDHSHDHSHDTDHSYSTDIRNTYHKIIVDNRVDQRVGKQIKVIVSRIEKLEITISQETRIIRDLNERLKVVRDESERTEIYKKIKRSELLIKTYRKEIEHETKFIKVIQTTTSTSKTEKKKAVKQLVKEVKKFEKVIKKEQHLVIVLKKKLETSSSSTSSTERDIMITKIAQLEKHIKHVKQVVAQEKKVIKVVKKTVIVKSDQDHSHDHSHDTDHSYSTDIRNTYHKIIVDNRVDQRVGKQIKVIVSRIEKLEITISQETRIIRDLNERLKVVRDESERTEIYKKIKRSELLIKTYRKEIEHETKFIKVIQTTTSTSKTEKKKAVKQLVKEVKKFEKVIKKEQHLVIVLKKKLETSSSSTSSTERDIMITKIAQLEKHIKHVKQVVAQEKKVIKVIKISHKTTEFNNKYTSSKVSEINYQLNSQLSLCQNSIKSDTETLSALKKKLTSSITTETKLIIEKQIREITIKIETTHSRMDIINQTLSLVKNQKFEKDYSGHHEQHNPQKPKDLIVLENSLHSCQRRSAALNTDIKKLQISVNALNVDIMRFATSIKNEDKGLETDASLAKLKARLQENITKLAKAQRKYKVNEQVCSKEEKLILQYKLNVVKGLCPCCTDKVTKYEHQIWDVRSRIHQAEVRAHAQKSKSSDIELSATDSMVVGAEEGHLLSI